MIAPPCGVRTSNFEQGALKLPYLLFLEISKTPPTKISPSATGAREGGAAWCREVMFRPTHKRIILHNKQTKIKYKHKYEHKTQKQHKSTKIDTYIQKKNTQYIHP